MTSAGILQSIDTFLDMDLDAHRKVWDVNYHGTVHACRSFGRMMRERRTGAIVTVGSINSFAALPLPAYCVGKTAILRLTEILAVELGVRDPRQRRRSDLCHHAGDAGENRRRRARSAGDPPKRRARHAGLSRTHRRVAAFLLSDAAAAVTGVMMPVDAGWSAATPYKSFVGGTPVP
ncbi:MAG: SDR family oxidoreductase [Geminicoccaceae bacterium]